MGLEWLTQLVDVMELGPVATSWCSAAGACTETARIVRAVCGVTVACWGAGQTVAAAENYPLSGVGKSHYCKDSFSGGVLPSVVPPTGSWIKFWSLPTMKATRWVMACVTPTILATHWPARRCIVLMINAVHSSILCVRIAASDQHIAAFLDVMRWEWVILGQTSASPNSHQWSCGLLVP